MLGDLKASIAERHIKLTWDEDAVSFLVEESFSIKYGARNLRRLIQREVEDGIATAIIDNYEGSISSVHLSSDGKKIIISTI